MKALFNQHHAALLSAFRRLAVAPLNSLLSLLAIGIALTLPGFGYVVLDNLRDLGRNASGLQEISVFMDLEAKAADVAEIEKRLQQVASAKWRFVPKDEALKRMAAREDMSEVVASLPRNPLPDAFVIEPGNRDPHALDVLRNELTSWPKVTHVQLDSAWVMRFNAFVHVGQTILLILAGLFAAGLVAVTFNTIRLQVMGQAAEIELSRMIGATDAFIKRPFYYYGALQGAVGGLLALALLAAAWSLLAGPVSELTALYGTGFALRLPGVLEATLLVTIGAFLGWLGAQLSVSLSLRKFD